MSPVLSVIGYIIISEVVISNAIISNVTCIKYYKYSHYK